MSNIKLKQDAFMTVWEKPEKIRKLFAPDLTADEFLFFIGLGKSMGANPFKREIWAVKYDKNKPAQIFLGRDFDRKKAQEQPDYRGHHSDAVYSNDDFKVVNGEPEHEYNLKDRGQLIGAYAIAKKEGCSLFFNYIDFKEYDLKQSLWVKKPATMIKKVAEAQVLRMAWQAVFAGTYAQDEKWEETETTKYDKEPPVKKKAEVIPEQQIDEEPGTPYPTEEETTEKMNDKKEKPTEGKLQKFEEELIKTFDGDADMVEKWLSDQTKDFKEIFSVNEITSVKWLNTLKGKLRK